MELNPQPPRTEHTRLESEGKNCMNTKPSRKKLERTRPDASNETVEVTVQLPKAFVEEFAPLADASGISLAEASRFIVESCLPQHFANYKEEGEVGDDEAEMHMLRHVLKTRPRACRK